MYVARTIAQIQRAILLPKNEIESLIRVNCMMLLSYWHVNAK